MSKLHQETEYNKNCEGILNVMITSKSYVLKLK